MERLSRDAVLMEVAQDIAQRGTCSRLQVGVVFSKGGRIISSGYNGAPTTLEHCIHEEWHPNSGEGMPPHIKQVVAKIALKEPPEFGKLISSHLYWDGAAMVAAHGDHVPGCTVAEHAERNAIAFSARYGVALDGCEMHVTHMPCKACAMSIINAGVTRVVYKHPYRKTEGLELLIAAGVQVEELHD